MTTSRTALLTLSVAIVLAAPLRVHAQEVDVTVQVNYDAVPTTNKDLLQNFGNDVKGYLTGFNWGGGDASEKVRCTIDIFVQSVTGDNKYTAQVFIGSKRPKFRTDQNTGVLRLFDESWEFTYLRERPITHNPYYFSDLASFLDFYMYIIMGYDYDTYDELSGTELFKQAASIANLGQSSGQKSWQLATTTFSRTQLVTEVLDPRYEPVRRAIWKYHYCGIDSLTLNPARAFDNILSALESIGRVRKTADPRSLIIKSFFDAKYLEIADIFKTYPDPNVYVQLIQIDPTNQKTYDEYRMKRGK
jgi:hypothetical protein